LKSPLRYPGGKTRAVKHILPHFPEDMKELCSPFLGGGSIELALANKGVKVHAYDIFEPLVCFWKHLIENPEALSEAASLHRHLDKQTFKMLQETLRNSSQDNIDYAAIFYALNRSSFSGSTTAGGYSKQAAEKRFTESSIKRIKDFKAKNISVKAADFKVSIAAHPDAFLYLDPPYLLGKGRETLYGANGSNHKGFDHLGLSETLKERSNWILSYNNCPEILKLYEDYAIIYPDWKYCMSSDKTSKEVLIINKEDK